jgi:hypothetical protein
VYHLAAVISISGDPTGTPGVEAGHCSPLLCTCEALHALKSDPTVSGAKAATELGHEARPLGDTVADTYDWFKLGGMRPDRALAA